MPKDLKLVILDRDGVINEDSDAYIKSPDEWQAIPGSLDAIASLTRADYKVVVVTNQSGVARGLFDLDMLWQIHAKMLHEVVQTGGAIEAIFFCPHGPQDGCRCRKPKPGLFEEVAERFDTDLTGVPAIGDSLRDIQAAQKVNAQPILVKTGKGSRTLEAMDESSDVPVFADLAAAVDALLHPASSS